VRSGGFTKHFFIETGRIASKLGESGKGKGNGNGGGGNGNNQEAFQFYYHADHLGNTAYITDKRGEVYQHLEYFPFGETFIEEHSNTWRTPYLYNDKEEDEETGLYYYGARYYDCRTSTWPSVDPMWHNPETVDKSPYAYVINNPLVYSDPDGRTHVDGHAGPNTTAQDAYALRKNLIADGIAEPDFANGAHHIIESHDEVMEEGRAVLKKFKIGINDPDNGVFLPKSSAVRKLVIAKNKKFKAPPHSRIHNGAYKALVLKRVAKAKSAKDARKILRKLRSDILAGKINKILNDVD
jgi:RHS repeat-associated protein